MPLCVRSLLQEYHSIFEPTVGHAPQYKCELELQPNATPVFQKAHPIPFVLHQRIEDEICNLVQDGIWVPVNTSNWATTIVPVDKSQGIRLCGGLSGTVNFQLCVAQHLFPDFDEVHISRTWGR